MGQVSVNVIYKPLFCLKATFGDPGDEVWSLSDLNTTPSGPLPWEIITTVNILGL
jgi:hypothetical protein